jgi:peptide/nickel transport system substrate-binding protein
MDFNCQAVVNPLVDITKYLSNDRAGNQYGRYQDRALDGIYDEMVRETDPARLAAHMRKFERRLLDEQAHQLVTLWWHRTVPHHARLKGWKVSPSHYLNQDLANVWLAPE